MSDETPQEVVNASKIIVMVATPVARFDKFHPKFEQFLKDLAELSASEDCPYEFIFATVDGGRTWGRCRLVANFRKLRLRYPNLKWLYWADDDVDQTAAGLLRLLSHKRPIVGALYTTKGDNPHWCCNFMYEVEVQPNGLLQVVEVAIGALLTHFQVYDIVEAAFPGLLYTHRDTGERSVGFFQESVIEKVPYSEDYFFCWLCRHSPVDTGEVNEDGKTKVKLGMGIFVDTQLKLRHRGTDGTLHPAGEWPPIPVDEKAPAHTD